MGERNPQTNQLETMLADYERLKEENATLRRLLIENGITIPAHPKSGSPPPAKPDAQDTGVHEHSGKGAKIALFRGLFRGREEVYAVRTPFKRGEWGYVIKTKSAAAIPPVAIRIRSALTVVAARRAFDNRLSRTRLSKPVSLAGGFFKMRRSNRTSRYITYI